MVPVLENNTRDLSASADESRAVTGPSGEGDALYVFDPTSGEIVNTAPSAQLGQGLVAISPDGRRILYNLPGSSSIEVLDIDTESVVSRYHGHPSIWGAWFSDDGEVVYSSGPDGTLQLWDPDTGAGLLTVPYGDSIAGVAVTPDFTRAAAFSIGDTVKVFDLGADLDPAAESFTLDETCQVARNLNRTLHVVGDRATLFTACGDADFHRGYVFDPHNGEVVDEYLPVDGGGVRLSPGGTTVAAQPIEGGISSAVAVFDVATRVRLVDMDGLCSKTYDGDVDPACEVWPEDPFADLPRNLRFSPDGSLLAMGGGLTNAVTVWDGESGELLNSWIRDSTRATGFGFSPDGSQLLVGAVSGLTLLSTLDWSVVAERSWIEEGGTAPGGHIYYVDDGSRIVTASDSFQGDSDVLLLDAETLETLDVISETHDGGVNAMDVSSSEELVATAGTDGFVRVWVIETGELVTEIPVASDGEATNVAFIDEDRRLIVTGDTGPVKIVSIDSADLVDLARTRVTRGLSQSECDQYQIDPCTTLEEIRTG
jgi:WD40 repeat protein